MQDRHRVGALHDELSVDVRVVLHFDEKTPPAAFDEIRHSGPSDDLHPRLGIDLDHREAVRIENLLNLGDDALVRRAVREGFETGFILGLEATPEKSERFLEAHHLRHQGLPLDTANDGKLLRERSRNDQQQRKQSYTRHRGPPLRVSKPCIPQGPPGTRDAPHVARRSDLRYEYVASDATKSMFCTHPRDRGLRRRWPDDEPDVYRHSPAHPYIHVPRGNGALDRIGRGRGGGGQR